MTEDTWTREKKLALLDFLGLGDEESRQSWDDLTPINCKLLINAFGGSTALARLLGFADRRNVDNWTRLGIPHVHKPRIRALCRKHGVPLIHELYTGRKKRSKKNHEVAVTRTSSSPSGYMEILKGWKTKP